MKTNPVAEHASPDEADARQARREWLTIAAFTIVALVPRFYGFGREGLTHFDEGVYAFSGFWSVSGRGIDPEVIAYAPPGLSILIGLAYAVLGIADVSALVVTGLCGALTVPVAGWVGRRTFGPGAGAAAAAFTTLSLAHVAFSRKALTDVPFLLTWLVAIGLGGRFLEKPRLGRALAFGLAVGIAQNFKYNGWLTGAIVALAALVGLVADRESRKPANVFRTFGLGGIAVLVAGLVYLPWYLFVENRGGYAALVRHHQSYMGGVRTWLPHWRQQLAQVAALSGGMAGGAVAWAGAWLASGIAARGYRLFFPQGRWEGARLRLGLMLGAAAMATIPDLAWWVGLAWSGWLVADRKPAIRLLGVWWLVLSVLTPFYHPYARLWLPLHAAGWIILAGGLVALAPLPGTILEEPFSDVMRHRRLLAQGAITLVCLLLSRVHWGNEKPSPLAVREFFEPTDGLRTLVAELNTGSPIELDRQPQLRVLARRPLAFYLATRSRVPFRLVPGEPEVAAGPLGPHDWALVDGVQIGDGTTDGARWSELETPWRRVSAWRRRLDPVTLLDVDPEAVYSIYPADPITIALLYPHGLRLPSPPDAGEAPLP